MILLLFFLYNFDLNYFIILLKCYIIKNIKNYTFLRIIGSWMRTPDYQHLDFIVSHFIVTMHIKIVSVKL